MFQTLFSQIGLVCAVAATAFAFLKGEQPERLGAGTFMLGFFASQLLQDLTQLQGAQWGMMAIDVVMLILFSALAWKSGRAWPVWVCALQSLIVMSHLTTILDLRPPVTAFIAVVNLSSYGILIAIVIGTFWAWQDRRAAGLE
jgi:hypothetical protein